MSKIIEDLQATIEFAEDFYQDKTGIYYTPLDERNKTRKKLFLADNFDILGDAYDSDGAHHYILEANHKIFTLSFADLGSPRGWAVLKANIRRWATSRHAQNHLVEYIQNTPLTHEWEIVKVAGWHEDAYILPNGEVIGNADKVLFENPVRNTAYEQHGDLEQWKVCLGQYLNNNPIPCLLTGAAFAAPLLPLLNMNGGIFHVYGNSSAGKSTSQMLAQSVWGNGKAAGQSWNATPLAITNAAAARNHGLLSLDEISEGKAYAISAAAYSLANGQGKLQGAKEGGNRAEIRFLVMGISSGEKSLQGYMTDAKRELNAGQQVRMPCIYGGLDNAHNFKTLAAFADHIQLHAQTTYGSAGRAFIEKIVKDKQAAITIVKTLLNRFLEIINANDLATQQARTAKLFAISAAALQLASRWDITGISEENALNGVMEAFKRWKSEQGAVNYEDERIKQNAIDIMPQLLPLFVPINGEQRANFYPNDFVGYCEMVDGQSIYYMLPKAFKEKIALGSDTYQINRATRILGDDMGWLSKGDGNRWQSQKKINGEKGRFYKFVGTSPPEA